MLAQLNFIGPMAVQPALDTSGGGRGNLQLEPHPVELADADALDPSPSLASHGFAAVPFSAPLPKAETDAPYRQDFAKLCADAVKKETGAKVVIGLPRGVKVRRSTAIDHKAPIAVVHTDFTPTTAFRRVTELYSQLGRTARPKRIAAYNAWWLASSGPQDCPLALCDATSIAAPDLQIGRAQVRGPQRSTIDYGEIAFQRYSPRHRWYWYSQLAPDRLLLFCGFDSDPSCPSMVTHSAFINPDCPADAPPRVSVECRCYAFW